jgi:hypothetical protein
LRSDKLGTSLEEGSGCFNPFQDSTDGFQQGGVFKTFGEEDSSEEIHFATPRYAIEGFNLIPDRKLR